MENITTPHFLLDLLQENKASNQNKSKPEPGLLFEFPNSQPHEMGHEEQSKLMLKPFSGRACLPQLFDSEGRNIEGMLPQSSSTMDHSDFTIPPMMKLILNSGSGHQIQSHQIDQDEELKWSQEQQFEQSSDSRIAASESEKDQDLLLKLACRFDDQYRYRRLRIYGTMHLDVKYLQELIQSQFEVMIKTIHIEEQNCKRGLILALKRLHSIEQLKQNSRNYLVFERDTSEAWKPTIY